VALPWEVRAADGAIVQADSAVGDGRHYAEPLRWGEQSGWVGAQVSEHGGRLAIDVVDHAGITGFFWRIATVNLGANEAELRLVQRHARYLPCPLKVQGEQAPHGFQFSEATEFVREGVTPGGLLWRSGI